MDLNIESHVIGKLTHKVARLYEERKSVPIVPYMYSELIEFRFFFILQECMPVPQCAERKSEHWKMS